MSGKVAEKGAVGQGTDADKYLKKLAPTRGNGDGPYNPHPPWLKDLHESGVEVLWEAVRRLEEIVHNGKTSAAMKGPYIVPKSGQPGPGPGRTPPPPPPAFP